MTQTPVIVVLDDEEVITEVCCDMIIQTFPNCECYKFTDPNQDFYDFVKTKKVDLFIVDIVLQDEDGRKVGKELCKIYPHTTFLFISGYDFSFESILETKCGCVFDFVSKPVKAEVLINRVQLLLEVREHHQKMAKQSECLQTKLSQSIWDIFNYSTFFVVMLDEDLNVLAANYFLATSLGFKDEHEIIGKNWLDFIVNRDKEIIRHIHKQVQDGDVNTREFINDIICQKNQITPVRWFNTCFNQGIDGTFSVGVPIVKEVTPQDTEEAIRSYWKDVIQKNKTSIKAIREILHKNTEENRTNILTNDK